MRSPLRLGIVLGMLALYAGTSLRAQSTAAVHLDRRGERWASATLRRMTLEEKIGQMIMVWARVEFMNDNSPDALRLREQIRTYHVGGFGVTVFTEGAALLRSQPLEAAALTNGLQAASKLPLLFAADFERGLAMRLTGATSFPAAMAFGAAGDPALAREFGRITAEESRAVGIHWNWFPVADVNSNPANPIINTRSFGEDPATVAAMVSAYIEGARSGGLLTTVKHFPGHGDTDTDSHLTLARSTATRERLDKVELVPFRAAIAAGVDSVMMAHITVPALEPDPDRPASISQRIVTGLLQQELGFHGLVVTDALDMGALTRVFPGKEPEISAREAVEAVRAGNDMVIIPADLGGAYNGLLTAVKSGELTQARIDASVLKILRLKASVGLNRNRFVRMDGVIRQVARPASVALAQQISARAITLVKDEKGLVPLAPSAAAGDASSLAGEPRAPLVALVFADDAGRSEGARAFLRLLREHVPGVEVHTIGPDTSAADARELLKGAVAAADKGGTIVALVEGVPVARHALRATSSGDDDSSKLLGRILAEARDRTIVAAFGNPYLAVQLPAISTYLCSFSNTPESANALAAALFSEAPISGHLPVSLPGYAPRGTGLMHAATVARPPAP